MATRIEELIDVARGVLSLGGDSVSEQLSAIERYSGLFSDFQREADLTKEDSKALEELNDLHAKVLETAKTLQGQLSGDLRSLKSKGKAILKYIDVLPSKISSVKPKKG